MHPPPSSTMPSGSPPITDDPFLQEKAPDITLPFPAPPLFVLLSSSYRELVQDSRPVPRPVPWSPSCPQEPSGKPAGRSSEGQPPPWRKHCQQATKRLWSSLLMMRRRRKRKEKPETPLHHRHTTRGQQPGRRAMMVAARRGGEEEEARGR